MNLACIRRGGGFAALPAIALLLLLPASCGRGVALDTFESECALGEGLRLSLQLPRGDITVLADLEAGSATATGSLAVYDNGIYGWTEGRASIEDVVFELAAAGECLSASIGDVWEATNFSYALEVHVPSDYRFWSAGAQTPNAVVTGEGKIVAKGLRGGEMGSRDFKFWADNPMSSFVSYPMTIEDVDGVITASAWGDVSIRDCRVIALVMCTDGDLDMKILPDYALAEVTASISNSGKISIALSRTSNFAFYNEIDSTSALIPHGIRNKGEPAIQGPTDVEFEFAPRQLIQVGDGSTGAFDVYCLNDYVEYSLYD